jgi:hypothetical protein
MRRTLYPVVALIALLLLAMPVQAGEDSGEKTLMWLEHHAVEIDNSGNDQLRISYDVQVTDGVNVNIYFMDEGNYDKFTDFENFSYYQSYSIKDTDGAEKEWTWSKGGTFYVVIENAGWQSLDTSTVEYDVTWDEGGALWWGLPIVMCIVLILVVGIVGVVALWLILQALKARRERTTEGTRGEGGTGVSPTGEGAAELGPQPEPPDMPAHAAVSPTGEGATQLSPQPEPPDMPAHATVSPTGEGATHLGPQPEPPDMPAHAAVSPTGEGATQLGPQPEPPDMPTGSPTVSGEADPSALDRLHPDATTYYVPDTTPMTETTTPMEPPAPEPQSAADTEPSEPLAIKKPGLPPPE